MSDRRVAPTRRKLADARRRGDVPVSSILVAAGGMVAGIAALEAVAGHGWTELIAAAQMTWSGGASAPLVTARLERLFVETLAPVAAATLAGALVVGLAQTRGLVAPSLLGDGVGATPRRDRRLLGLPLGMLAAALSAAAVAVEHGVLATAFSRHGGALLVALAASLVRIALRVATWMIVVGVGDYFWRRARWLRSLHTTRAEAEGERREDEGDPRFATERRRRHASHGNRSALPAAAILITGDESAVTLVRSENRVRLSSVARGLEAAAHVEAARRNGVPIRSDVALTDELLALAPSAPLPVAVESLVEDLIAGTRRRLQSPAR